MNIEETFNCIKNKYNLIAKEETVSAISLNFHDVTLLYLDKIFNTIYLADELYFAIRM